MWPALLIQISEKIKEKQGVGRGSTGSMIKDRAQRERHVVKGEAADAGDFQRKQ
jgi:hypothetical protein